MVNFLTAEQAKVYSDYAKLDIELYKQRLAALIEENAILQFLPCCQNIYL